MDPSATATPLPWTPATPIISAAQLNAAFLNGTLLVLGQLWPYLVAFIALVLLFNTLERRLARRPRGHRHTYYTSRRR